VPLNFTTHCVMEDRLYPLTQGEKAVPKALLPIGNGVIIDRVLDWVELGGIRGTVLVQGP
jgi:NDP-sugar pyrophosphorylase family protein